MASTEKGASPRLSLATGIWCASAKAIRSVRLLKLPFAPGRDDLDVGVQRIGGELEAHLVIALAGGAMGHGIGAGLAGDLDQALGDQRPGDRGAEQVDALIDRIGAEHREDEVADELLAQVLDVDFLDAQHLGLLARRLQLAALAQVGGEGHDLGAIFGLQPLQDDRGIEAARIGEDDFLDLLLGHRRTPSQTKPRRGAGVDWAGRSNDLLAARRDFMRGVSCPSGVPQGREP